LGGFSCLGGLGVGVGAGVGSARGAGVGLGFGGAGVGDGGCDGAGAAGAGEGFGGAFGAGVAFGALDALGSGAFGLGVAAEAPVFRGSGEGSAAGVAVGFFDDGATRSSFGIEVVNTTSSVDGCAATTGAGSTIIAIASCGGDGRATGPAKASPMMTPTAMPNTMPSIVWSLGETTRASGLEDVPASPESAAVRSPQRRQCRTSTVARA